MKNNQAATIYEEALAALERRASLDKIQPLLDVISRSRPDRQCRQVRPHNQHARSGARQSPGRSGRSVRLELHSRCVIPSRTRISCTMRHRAVSGGADIINWAILEANAPLALLIERILVPDQDWLAGNGHTVAMEAAFNDNAPVIEALIDINASGRKVDLTTPAQTGWTPRGFALREGFAFAEDLPPAGQTLQVARDAMTEFAGQQGRSLAVDAS